VAFVSALDGSGLDQLRQAIETALRSQMVRVDAVIPYDRGKLAARARAVGQVEEAFETAGIRISGDLPPGVAAEVLAATPRPPRGNDMPS
jgi:GTP-binding protein HflX